MKRIITLTAAVLGLCLQAFAAKPEAPVLALGANGADAASVKNSL